MKKSKSMIYNFLLFLFIILVAVIYIEYRKNLLNNELKNNNQKTIENFATLPEFKIDEMKVRVDDETKDITGKEKALFIEGEKLSDIKQVFFGNLNGKLIRPVGKEENQLFVLPPNFGKYEKDALKLNSLEIKFLIQTEKIIEDPVFVSKENNIINFKDKNIEDDILVSDKSLLKSKLVFYLESEININDYSILINDIKYDQLDIIKKGEKEKIELNIEAPIKKQNISLEIDFEINDTSDLIPNPSPSDSNDIFTIFDNPKPQLTYLFDDISTLLPTGLFYRHSKIDEATDSEAWNVYLDSDNNKEPDHPELKKFYYEMKKYIAEEEKEEESKPIKTFKPKNMKLEFDSENETLMILTWVKPSLPLTDRFTYVLNINPITKDKNDKLFENDFKLKDEKIHFEKNEFIFPNNDMIPTNEYEIILQVYSYENSKLFEKADTLNGKLNNIYKFSPDNINLYHKHIFKDGKFNSDLTQENPELLQTYAELNAYNKMKTQEDLLAAGDYIKSSSQCLSNNIKDFNNNENTDNYEDAFKKLLKKDQEEEDALFRIKQDEQLEDTQRINNKIAQLEELQGKVLKNQETNILNLKSRNDGTNLGLINLENNKRLIKLNKGCLTLKSDGNYGYIPCNLLDEEQYFNLGKINNVDEYNNLLLMNNNSPIDVNQNKSVEYPFYIMHPNKSLKCVNVENGNLSIQPCNNQDSIRFSGDFVEKSCPN